MHTRPNRRATGYPSSHRTIVAAKNRCDPNDPQSLAIVAEIVELSTESAGFTGPQRQQYTEMISDPRKRWTLRS